MIDRSNMRFKKIPLLLNRSVYIAIVAALDIGGFDGSDNLNKWSPWSLGDAAVIYNHDFQIHITVTS